MANQGRHIVAPSVLISVDYCINNKPDKRGERTPLNMAISLNGVIPSCMLLLPLQEKQCLNIPDN